MFLKIMLVFACSEGGLIVSLIQQDMKVQEA